jgi:hypothetical protein
VVTSSGRQIVDKAGILGHFGFVDAKKLDDDLLSPLGDVAHSLASFPYPENQTRRGRGRYRRRFLVSAMLRSPGGFRGGSGSAADAGEGAFFVNSALSRRTRGDNG